MRYVTVAVREVGIATMLVVLLAVAGCISKKEEPMPIMGPRLDYTKGVLVSTPPNGQYKDEYYPRSGEYTAETIAAAFSQYSSRVTVTDTCHGGDCMTGIDTTRYGYYVEPTILRWEDRSYEWSGFKDKIEIRIAVYDAETGRKISETTFEGRSKWMTLGGDDPRELLPDPTDEYVDSLY